ncbi:MAG: TetR/AcrR family transcriptional regulator [Clostridiales bacterium]|nr:TetR/AcrR family transcriptional regulator [Clostridiales bacterium]
MAEHRRQRDSQRTKQDILMAAEHEFADKGIYGARIDDIASRANINKRMIYEYFGNKEQLYKTVLEESYRRLGKREKVILSKGLDCRDAIRRIIRLEFEFLRDNPTYVKLILWENLNHGKYIEDIDFTDIKNPTFILLKKAIAQGKRDGVFKEDLDEEQLILSILTFTFSYFSNRYTLSKLLEANLDHGPSLTKRIEHVTDMVLLYICKQKP